MAATLVVLGVVAGGCFVAALLALRRDRSVTAAWLLTVGSAVMTVWAGLGLLLAGSGGDGSGGPALLPPTGYLSMGVLALVTTLYFFQSARTGGPLPESS
jgi:hypothetical protein